MRLWLRKTNMLGQFAIIHLNLRLQMTYRRDWKSLVVDVCVDLRLKRYMLSLQIDDV